MTLGELSKPLVQIFCRSGSIEYGRKLPIVDAVVWHFFPSARSIRVGPTPALLDELKLRGIKAKIYLP